MLSVLFLLFANKFYEVCTQLLFSFLFRVELLVVHRSSTVSLTSVAAPFILYHRKKEYFFSYSHMSPKRRSLLSCTCLEKETSYVASISLVLSFLLQKKQSTFIKKNSYFNVCRSSFKSLLFLPGFNQTLYMPTNCNKNIKY